MYVPSVMPQIAINTNTNTKLGCLSHMIRNVDKDNFSIVIAIATTYLGKYARYTLPVRKQDVAANRA